MKKRVSWVTIVVIAVLLILAFYLGIKKEVLPSPTSSTIPGEKETEVVMDSILYRDNALETGKMDVLSRYREPKEDYVPNEIIIKFKEEPEIRETSGLLNKAKISTKFPSINNLNKKYQVKSYERVFKQAKEENLKKIVKFKIKSKEDLKKIIEEYYRDENVEYAEPNYIYYTQFTPNDARFSEQWAHQNTQAELGWDIEQGNSDIVIAIIDTGVDWQHEDLSDNIWSNPNEIADNGIDDDLNGYIDDIRGWDFVNTPYQCYVGEDCLDEDNNPSDFQGHGTHVAGIVAAKGNNNLGVSGVCINCKVMALRAGYANTNGDGGLTDDGISNALHYAADNNAKIISMSFGGSGSITMQNAIDYAYSKGLVLIAATGNSQTNSKFYPAAYDNVIAITATDSNDMKASFSNYGYWTDVAAPGVNILSTVVKNGIISDASGYKSISGTSMATPYVSGLAGLILSKNPAWSQEEVKRILEEGIDNPNGQNYYIGTGRVNVYKALQINSVSDYTIDNPSYNSIYKLGVMISIEGTIRGNFDHYIIEYGYGNNPPQWFSNGITLTNNGMEELIDGVIAIWDTNYSALGGYYTIRLTVNYGDRQGYEFVRVYLDPTLMGDFPVKLPELESYGPLSVANSNEGYKNILLTGAKRDLIQISSSYNFLIIKKVFFINYTGNIENEVFILNGIYESSPLPLPDVGKSATADIDKDGNDEVIATNSFELLAFNNKGESSRNWDPTTTYPEVLVQGGFDPKYNYAFVIEDMDGNGEEEIISHIAREDSSYYLKIFDSRGVEKYTIGQDSEVQSYNYHSFSVGDLDYDGKKEIISIMNLINGGVYYVGIFDNTGRLINLIRGFENRIINSVNIVDLDNDGRVEIVIISSGSRPEATKIHIFDNQGGLINEWVVCENYYGLTYPAFGNVDSEGGIDIILTCTDFLGGRMVNKLSVYSNNGEILHGYPVALDYDEFPSTRELFVGDIDNDGNIEIVGLFSTYEKSTIAIFKNNGDFWGDWVKYIDSNGDASALFYNIIITDIDNNGMTDLIALGKPRGNRDDLFIYAWDLNVSYNLEKMEWPMFRHDPQHTGNYHFGRCNSNGIRESIEKCDGSDLGGQTCQNLGYTEGILSCLPTCLFDTSQCYSDCGNNIAEIREVCDGIDLAGQTCQDFGYVNPESLFCSPTCSSYDTSGCVAVCNNDMKEPGEQCDGNDDTECPGLCQNDCKCLPPVAYYPFDSDVNDYSRNNHGTIIGNPVFVEGKVGQALQFDGIDDYVEVPHSEELNVGGYFPATWMFWAYSNEIGNDETYTLSKGPRSYQGRYSVGIHLGWGVIMFYVGQYPVFVGEGLNFLGWHHYTIVWDGSSMMYFYINGERVGSYSFSPSRFPYNDKTLTIGAADSSPPFYFKGSIDEVKIYSRALSQEEIQQEYRKEQFTLTLHPGWNLVSIPLNPINASRENVFPSSIVEAVWQYNNPGGYVTPSVIEPGKGYWVKSNSDAVIQVRGIKPADDTVQLNLGWNLIGVVGNQNFPTESFVQAVWEYLPPYNVPTNLFEGRGFWIKASQSGTLFTQQALSQAEYYEATQGGTCGNNIREGLEECDGKDSLACPNACVNCICTSAPQTPRCYDSDRGINYTLKGTTSGANGNFVDSCSKNQLTEYYCSEPNVNNIKYNCNKGCSNGACKIQKNNYFSKLPLVSFGVNLSS